MAAFPVKLGNKLAWLTMGAAFASAATRVHGYDTLATFCEIASTHGAIAHALHQEPVGTMRRSIDRLTQKLTESYAKAYANRSKLAGSPDEERILEKLAGLRPSMFFSTQDIVSEDMNFEAIKRRVQKAIAAGDPEEFDISRHGGQILSRLLSTAFENLAGDQDLARQMQIPLAAETLGRLTSIMQDIKDIGASTDRIEKIAIRSELKLIEIAEAARRIEAGFDRLARTNEAEDFSPSIRQRMRLLNQQVESLTRDQYKVIDYLRNFRRVRISGCAGSGKTLVAAEKAIRLAEMGLRTLILCHNPLLARHVASSVEGTGVDVAAFCDWVRGLAGIVESSGLPLWTKFDEPTPATVAAAFDVLVETGGRYDAVLVDEGQDFRSEWWTLVEAVLVLQDRGILYIFHDDHQALLPHRAAYPIGEPSVDLSRNCRNSGRVFDLVRSLHYQAPATEVALRDVGATARVIVPTGQEQLGLQAVLREIFDNGVDPKDIAILVGGGEIERDSELLSVPLQVSKLTSEVWRTAVTDYLQVGFRHLDRRGTNISDEGSNAVRDLLDQLSHDDLPDANDVAIVTRASQKFSIDPAIRRRIERSRSFANALEWDYDGRRLHLVRSHPSPLWSAELVLFFERNDWHKTLPQARRIYLSPQSPSNIDSIGLFQIEAFKGLESNVVILLSRGHRPITIEECYVGVSRARFALYIVDCGGKMSMLGGYPVDRVETLSVVRGKLSRRAWDP